MQQDRSREAPERSRRVYEAGAVIVCDGKIALRLTDQQNWIFPKGGVKKHETPADAAIREATEETGLVVELVEQLADLLIRHEGKKRRFVFYLMRATGRTADWPHHDGRDTFLVSPDHVGELLRAKDYGKVWEAARDRVGAL